MLKHIDPGSNHLRDELWSDYSDAYKAFYGMRPRSVDLSMTDGEILDEISSLYRSASIEAEQRQR